MSKKPAKPVNKANAKPAKHKRGVQQVTKPAPARVAGGTGSKPKAGAASAPRRKAASPGQSDKKKKPTVATSTARKPVPAKKPAASKKKGSSSSSKKKSGPRPSRSGRSKDRGRQR